jgi:hypothetical protein
MPQKRRNTPAPCTRDPRPEPHGCQHPRCSGGWPMQIPGPDQQLGRKQPDDKVETDSQTLPGAQKLPQSPQVQIAARTPGQLRIARHATMIKKIVPGTPHHQSIRMQGSVRHESSKACFSTLYKGVNPDVPCRNPDNCRSAIRARA